MILPSPAETPTVAGASPDSAQMVSAILIVDDRKENLLSMQALLSDLGARLVVASSGREALRRVLQDDFAAILLDVQMPEMDGLETASLIRSRQRSQHTPILFITAFQQDDALVRRAYEGGAVDFLFKPVVGEILRSKVRVFVELWEQGRKIERQAARLLEAERLREAERLERERRQWEAARLEADLERERQFRAELERSYQRLKDLEAMRDDLSHMIVHDLRSPLCSFLTGLETLRMDEGLTADQAELLDLAISGGNQLLGMINDLLDIAKLEAGEMRLERSSVDLSRLALEALQSVRSLAEAKELRLERRLPAGLPPCEADGEKLRRVLVNLLGNAIKFSPRGSRIVLEARPVGGSVRLAVRDFGEGIPAEAFERIFDKFGQVESRRSGKGASTGLGLTFCRLVAEAHGGRIWVESELGQGSTFYVELPWGRETEAEPATWVIAGGDAEDDQGACETDEDVERRLLPLAA